MRFPKVGGLLRDRSREGDMGQTRQGHVGTSDPTGHLSKAGKAGNSRQSVMVHSIFEFFEERVLYLNDRYVEGTCNVILTSLGLSRLLSD